MSKSKTVTMYKINATYFNSIYKFLAGWVFYNNIDDENIKFKFITKKAETEMFSFLKETGLDLQAAVTVL